MATGSSHISILKDMVLPTVPDEPNAGKFKTAALLRLVFVFPLLYGFTLCCLLWVNVSIRVTPYPQSLALWISLALINIALNVSMLFIRDTRVCGALSILCIANELISNEIIIYLTGGAASHALLFILLSVAIYRVYFNYRHGLFAAIFGTVMHLAAAVLLISGALPPAPVQYASGVMPQLPGVLAWASTISLAIGVVIAFSAINLAMNRLHRVQRQLAENWKKDLDSIERFNEQVMECPDEAGVYAETMKAVSYATPYRMVALFEHAGGVLNVKACSGWNRKIVQALWEDAGGLLPGKNEMITVIDTFGENQPVFCFSLECGTGNPAYLAVGSPETGEPDAHQKSMLLNIAQSAGDAVNTLRLIRLEQEKGYKDALTGLYNKRFLQETLPAKLRIAAESGEPFCAAMFDIDGFKAYNDAFGHLAGDELLKRVGQSIQDTLREGDAAVRFGGEEFLILLAATGMEGGEAAAERVREAVERIEDPNRRVTVSGGVAVFPADAMDAELLIECADRRLYRAKKAGKNKVLSN